MGLQINFASKVFCKCFEAQIARMYAVIRKVFHFIWYQVRAIDAEKIRVVDFGNKFAKGFTVWIGGFVKAGLISGNVDSSDDINFCIRGVVKYVFDFYAT